MYKHETKIRVRYSETDKMGVVYYGNYAQYFEVGRVEFMRDLGVVYADLEKSGILMPVVRLETNYKNPAVYDEELTVETWIETLPTSKIVFHNRILGTADKLVCEGKVTLVFINEHFRPMKAPEQVISLLQAKGVQ